MTCFVHQTFATKPSFETEFQLPKVKISDKNVLAASQVYFGAFWAKEALKSFRDAQLINSVLGGSRNYSALISKSEFAALFGLGLSTVSFLSAYRLYKNNEKGSSKTDKALAVVQSGEAMLFGTMTATALFDKHAKTNNPFVLMAHLASSSLTAYKLVK